MQKDKIAELILSMRQAKATQKRLHHELDQELKGYLERTRSPKDAETQLSFIGLDSKQKELDDTDGLKPNGSKKK